MLKRWVAELLGKRAVQRFTTHGPRDPHGAWCWDMSDHLHTPKQRQG